MSISVAAGAAPLFLSIPYVNKAADDAAQIVATSMQALVHRIYQLDPSAYWQGSLGASDLSTEVITIGLYQGSSQLAQALDSFILLNNNLNNFVLEYCTDYVPGVGGAAGTGTWQTLATVTGNLGADYRLFQGSPTAAINGLRLTMTTTYPANEQKKLGNLIAALSTFQLGSPPSNYLPIPRQRRVDVELADGTTDSTYFYWSDNSFTLYTLDFEFDFLNVYNTSDKANLDALLASPAPFLVYPEPGDTSRAVYLCLFEPGSYTPGWNTTWKGGGRKIRFKLRQVGFL